MRSKEPPRRARAALWTLLFLTCTLATTASGETTYSLLLAEFAGRCSLCAGFSAAGIGDVDGDGRPDFIVGAPNGCPSSPAFAAGGQACVYSGLTGATIYELTAESSHDEFGFSVAGVGDLDGDVVPDFIVGARRATIAGALNAGAAFVYSGATGAPLYRVEGGPGYLLGSSIAGIGDVDSDGRADFALGAPGATDSGAPGPGSVLVYSGANGQLLFRKDGLASGETFGASLAAAGDIVGDAKGDLIVGAVDMGCDNTFPLNGSVYIFSGGSGALVRRITAADPCSQFGMSVAGAGDVNGDGVPDVLVGAPISFFSGAGDAGAALLYSGATGGLIRRSDGVSFSHLGTAVSGAGDVDGDGVRDLLAGAPWDILGGPLFSGSAFLYSGADGSVLFDVAGRDRFAYLGQAVANIGDTNGDGRDDFLVGAPGAVEYDGASFVGGAFVFGLVDLVAARAFTRHPEANVYLGAGSPTCVQLEPVAAAYRNAEVLSASIVMRFVGTSLREIRPVSVQAAPETDTDGNGATEIGACFGKGDLRHFLDALPAGADTVTVLVEGNLTTGKRFRAPLLLRVFTRPVLAGTVVPNPLKRSGTLTFVTARPGSLRVRLFDVHGRLVRRLTEEPLSPAGYHDLAIDGRSDHGEILPTGIYFYRVDASEGTTVGRIAILR